MTENVVVLGKEQVDLCNSLENVAYAPKELVASFKLLVLEEETGAWGIIETKAQKATDTEGDISSNNERNLKIIIGEPDPNVNNIQ